MMYHEMEDNLVDRRCLNRYRNHRWYVRSTTTTFDVLLLFLLLLTVFINSGSIPEIVSAVAWTTTPSTTTTTTAQRSVSHIKHNNIAFSCNERQRLLVSFSTPIQTSNIDDKNNEYVSPSPPPTSSTQLLFLPSSSCKVDQLSGTDLAYIGDVVYELFIRTRTVWPLKRTSDLQRQVVALVRGKLLCQSYSILFGTYINVYRLYTC